MFFFRASVVKSSKSRTTAFPFRWRYFWQSCRCNTTAKWCYRWQVFCKLPKDILGRGKRWFPISLVPLFDASCVGSAGFGYWVAFGMFSVFLFSVGRLKTRSIRASPAICMYSRKPRSQSRKILGLARPSHKESFQLGLELKFSVRDSNKWVLRAKFIIAATLAHLKKIAANGNTAS